LLVEDEPSNTPSSSGQPCTVRLIVGLLYKLGGRRHESVLDGQKAQLQVVQVNQSTALYACVRFSKATSGELLRLQKDTI